VSSAPCAKVNIGGPSYVTRRPSIPIQILCHFIHASRPRSRHCLYPAYLMEVLSQRGEKGDTWLRTAATDRPSVAASSSQAGPAFLASLSPTPQTTHDRYCPVSGFTSWEVELGRRLRTAVVGCVGLLLSLISMRRSSHSGRYWLWGLDPGDSSGFRGMSCAGAERARVSAPARGDEA